MLSAIFFVLFYIKFCFFCSNKFASILIFVKNSFFFKIIVKSINNRLFLYSNFLVNLFNRLDISFRFFSFPKRKKIITLLKSPHVNKKSREQFLLEKYKCVFFIKFPIKALFLKFLLINKPKFIKLILKRIV
jgi:ribosomal protein S10